MRRVRGGARESSIEAVPHGQVHPECLLPQVPKFAEREENEANNEAKTAVDKCAECRVEERVSN